MESDAIGFSNSMALLFEKVTSTSTNCFLQPIEGTVKVTRYVQSEFVFRTEFAVATFAEVVRDRFNRSLNGVFVTTFLLMFVQR